MSAHYATCKYDDATGSYIPLEFRPINDALKNDDPLYQEGFQAGASSRDAEIADLTKQREELEFSWAGCSQQLKDACAGLDAVEQERDELRAQVLAQQARIEELHHALSMPCDRWNKTQHKIVSKAISTPDDLSALQATIQKTSEMTRERASNVCNELEQYWSDYKDAALLNGDITLSNAASGEPRAARAIAEAIRALPAVTLEDLK